MTAFVADAVHVCVYWSSALDAPTFIVNVFASCAVSGRTCADAGSVDLGYVWVVALPSLVHVNVIELSEIITESPATSIPLLVAETNVCV